MPPPPAKSGDSDPILRIAKILEERQRAEGSYVRLAGAITEADRKARGKPPAPKAIIDRRKLLRIVEEPREVSLSYRDLVALDHYLEQFGQGLARWPILVRPTLLATLGESPEIKFLLGAKVEKRSRAASSHTYLSEWDVTAHHVVQRELNHLGKAVRIDFENIILEGTRKRATESLRGSWIRALGNNGPSLVCLGSPRASHAAEAMLAEMFGLKPFARTPAKDGRLPFHFVRPKEADLGVPSALALHGRDVVHIDPAIAQKVLDAKAWALRIGDRLLLAETGRLKTETYGIIAAQRRPGGQVWIVLAGLSGPGTLAAANCLGDLKATLPEPSGAQPANVLWVVVRAVVKDDRRRSRRLLLQHEVVGGIRRFDAPA